jgi:hypothetical protein
MLVTIGACASRGALDPRGEQISLGDHAGDMAAHGQHRHAADPVLGQRHDHIVHRRVGPHESGVRWVH